MTDRPAHEELLLSLRDQDFAMWRHNPITAAYLKFIEDQVEAFRTAAADLVESGMDTRLADQLKGRITTLRELATLSLGDIHEFYRQEGTEGKDDGDTDPARAGATG